MHLAREWFRSLAVLGTAAGCAILTAQAVAQGFPNRPISVLYPYPPGSGTEVTLRTITQGAGRLLGQPIVFENRTGASGRAGLTAMQKASGDGYTVAVAPDSLLVLQPIADPNFKLEAGKDYLPVGLAVQSYLTLTANPSVPFRDVKGLIAYAKANPGKLNWGFVPGASAQVLKEIVVLATGIEVTGVPYKGAVPANSDLLNGTLDLLASTVTAKPFIETGKLVAIAVSSPNRWSPFPAVPTFTEAGISVVYSTWFGMIVHPATPADVVLKLNGAINQSMRSPEAQKMLLQNGYNAELHMTPQDFNAFIRSEIERLGPVIRKAGIQFE
jgi:tripartite-type tricarboxylate transporter receptor subunit TctC